MGREPADHVRLRVGFVAAGFVLWTAPFVYALVRNGGGEGPLWPLFVVVAFPVIPYFLYWMHVGTRTGSIVAGVALAAIIGGSHVVVSVSSAAGDEQAGILYLYVLGAAALVVFGVDLFEQRRAGKRKR
ncbi:MAG TPA: hypothetical protein VG318_13910 [Actinomycetota bacterium]|nr:hypothetical protein [Actinomycetota bacterium]